MKRKHLIYVDDDELLVMLTMSELRRFGHRVRGFTQWKKAIEVFERESAAFDLIVTDMYMPGMTGIALAAQLKQMRSDVRIVLCSGHLTEEIRTQAKNAGIVEMLSKPNSPKDLAAAIHQLMALHQV